MFFVHLGAKSSSHTKHEDYSLAGRKSSATLVSGILLGALVGGASTVGTVQMAYAYGLPAWWFTLGGGIGCLVLGLFFAVPLRSSGLETITQFLAEKYGHPTAKVSMWASVMGTFISVVAQFLAGAAMLRSIIPANDWIIMFLFSLIILAFIFLGGLKSYSKIGVYKIALLYGILLLCFLVSLKALGDFGQIWRTLPRRPFFSLFGNGVGKGLNAGVSLVVGVLCTQIYIQAIYSSSSPKTAKKGALIAALLMPPLGLLGIWIGLYLRSSGINIQPSEALPYFIHNYFHPALAGAIWAGILITVVGTAAGLALGMATNIVSDFIIPLQSSKTYNTLSLNRITVLVVILGAALIAVVGKSSMILEWSYLSMGLRGAGTFFPLVLGILKPGMLPSSWAFASSILGLSTTLLWPLTNLPLKPLFAGLGASALMTLVGSISNVVKKKRW